MLINVSRRVQHLRTRDRERCRAVACCPLLHYVVCQAQRGNLQVIAFFSIVSNKIRVGGGKGQERRQSREAAETLCP